MTWLIFFSFMSLRLLKLMGINLSQLECLVVVTLTELLSQSSCHNYHFVKIVQLGSFFWSVFSCIQTVFLYFPVFVNICIQSEYRKIGPGKTPHLDAFHAVYLQMRTLDFHRHYQSVQWLGEYQQRKCIYPYRCPFYQLASVRVYSSKFEFSECNLLLLTL